MEKGKKESLQGVGKDIKIENAVAPSSSQSSWYLDDTRTSDTSVTKVELKFAL